MKKGLLSCYIAKTCHSKSQALLILLLCCFVALQLAFPPPVFAQLPESWSSRCKASVPGGGEVATIQGFECIFKNIVRILVPLAGIAFFIMIIVGAFQLITAGGEPKALQKARMTLTFAIVGLVAFLGIWFILQLIKAITGVDVTIFNIPR